jgi:hypothetical protein
MATKAQEYRAQSERTGRPDPKRQAKAAADARDLGTGRMSHNDAPRVDRHGAYALEEAGARPSRKSTRASSNRMKADGALRVTARERSAAPSARHDR